MEMDPRALELHLERCGLPAALWPRVLNLIQADDASDGGMLDFIARPCVDEGDMGRSVCLHSPVVAITARSIRFGEDVLLLSLAAQFKDWADAATQLHGSGVLTTRLQACLGPSLDVPYHCAACALDCRTLPAFRTHLQSPGHRRALSTPPEGPADASAVAQVFAALPNYLFSYLSAEGTGSFCIGDEVAARLVRCTGGGNFRCFPLELPDGTLRLVAWPIQDLPAGTTVLCESTPSARDACRCFAQTNPDTSLYDCFSYASMELLPEHRMARYHFLQDGFLPFVVEVDIPFETTTPVERGGPVWNAAFNLGLAILPSVALGFPFQRVIVQAGPLSAEQREFWRTLFLHCRAEHCLLNELEFDGEMEVQSLCPPDTPCDPSIVMTGLPTRHAAVAPGPGEVIVPLGGGKDSIVVFTLLQQCGVDPIWFFLGGFPGEYKKGRYPDVVAVSQTTQPVLVLEQSLSWQGCWSNCVWPLHHVFSPQATLWTAECCFASVLACLLRGARYIAVGNERSANEGNAVYCGFQVNHQYDKSFAFEAAAHNYIKQYIAPDVYYFSALQPLWELQVCRVFCRHPEYFPVFMSCNTALQDVAGTQDWCRECPKCAFLFLMLSAFLAPADVEAIFNGVNLFHDPDLVTTFRALLGLAGSKPLECVGTSAESKAASWLARQQYATHGVPLPPLLRDLGPAVGQDQVPLLQDAAFEASLVPVWLEDILRTVALAP